MYERKTALRGSERRILPGAREQGSIDRAQAISVTIYVRPNPASASLGVALDDLAARPLGMRPSDGAIAGRDASLDDLAAVATFARGQGLQIVDPRIGTMASQIVIRSTPLRQLRCRPRASRLQLAVLRVHPFSS